MRTALIILGAVGYDYSYAIKYMQLFHISTSKTKTNCPWTLRETNKQTKKRADKKIERKCAHKQIFDMGGRIQNGYTRKSLTE